MDGGADQHDGASAHPRRPTPPACHRINIFDMDLTRSAREADARVQLGHGGGRDVLILEFFAISANDVVRITADFAGVRPQKSAGVQTSWQCGHISALDRLQSIDADFCTTRKLRQRNAALLTRLSQFCAKVQRLLVGHRVADNAKAIPRSLD